MAKRTLISTALGASIGYLMYLMTEHPLGFSLDHYPTVATMWENINAPAFVIGLIFVPFLHHGEEDLALFIVLSLILYWIIIGIAGGLIWSFVVSLREDRRRLQHHSASKNETM